MKYFFLLIFLILSFSTVSSQTLTYEQFASSVINFSSEFSPTNYSASKALGSPNVYPQCGDNIEAWESTTADGQREFLELGFSTPQPVNTIRIYQNVAPGAIDTIYLRNAANGVWTKVYTATAVDNGQCPGASSLLLEITISLTPYNADAIRIAVNSPAVGYWNAIDAVAIANFDLIGASFKQYAAGVIDFSSQYSSPSWEAAQATGAPNAAICNDDPRAWASLSADGQREFLELIYSTPAKVNRMKVYQNIAPGAIDSVYLREVSTGIWHKIFTTTAVAKNCTTDYILELNFTKTTYKVDAVRIAVNSPAVTYWNEIDAVELNCELAPGARQTAQSGNWSNPSTWVGNIVPSAADSAAIGNSHNVTLDINTTVDGLFISPGGTLTIANPDTLTIGPSGGSSRQVIISGSLVLSAGKLVANGSILFSPSSVFNMTGGTISEDGNNGTLAGSVPNGLNLIEFSTGMSSFIFSGGTMMIVDPPFGTSGNALKCPYNFDIGSTLIFGDGVSTTQGNTVNGFGGNTLPPQLGNLTVNTINPSKRDVIITNATITILNECRVTTGQLQTNGTSIVNGNVINNDSLKINSSFVTAGNMINNGKLVTTGTFTVNGDMSNSSVSVFNSFYSTVIANNLFNFGAINATSNLSVAFDFTNNTGAGYVATAYTSVGRNIVNNGSWNSSWLYFANNFTRGALAQTIGGTGTFSIYGFEPNNSHPAGISLLRSLEIQSLFFDSGKIFLNNNDLTVDNITYGNVNKGDYVVINGTGKYINKNVVGPILFPIGTSDYTPVTIVTGGGGHTFSASVKTSFTNPPLNSSVVNREWNITDITGGPVSANITFQWNAADEDPSFNRALCYVGHYGPTWMSVTGYAPANGTDPYTRTATNITTFSPFAVGSNGAFGGAPLPVTLTSFTAKKSVETVVLKWKTESEINVSHYEIERSIDARNFEKVLVKTAAGLLAPVTYDITDLNPNKGINYYRLKEIDNDGKYFYSNIIRVDLNKKYTVVINPNPAKNKIFISGSENFKEVQLINNTGAIVKRWNKNITSFFNIENIPSGMYFVKLISDDEVQTHKLIIE